MIVVGLSGYARSGKDTVADILVRDYGFTKMAFADPIKTMVRDLDPIVGHHQEEACCADCEPEIEDIRLSDLYSYGLTDDEIKRDFRFGGEVRRLWQYFGTEVMRSRDDDFWIKQAEDRLFEGTSDRVVFTDVRFENEAEFIYDQREPIWWGPTVRFIDNPNSSSLWRIARPGVVATDHVSEQMIGLLGEEVTILNNDTIADLEEPVALAMDMLLRKDYPAQLQVDFGGLL
jgi:hypothetical protein